MVENRIFLTGASGFTGSWLAEHLLNTGAAVTTLLLEREPETTLRCAGIQKRVSTVHGSILDFDLLVRTIAEHGIDTVFHLAAVSVEGESYEGPRETFEVNIRGTYNVRFFRRICGCELSRRARIRLDRRGLPPTFTITSPR
jgi:CDP-glucose 4,6-dehydratase